MRSLGKTMGPGEETGQEPVPPAPEPTAPAVLRAGPPDPSTAHLGAHCPLLHATRQYPEKHSFRIHGVQRTVGASGKEAGPYQEESAQDGPEEAARPPAGPGGVQPRACFACVCWSATHCAGHVHGIPYSPPGSPGPGGSQPSASRARKAREDRLRVHPPQYHKGQEKSDLSLQKTNSRSK